MKTFIPKNFQPHLDKDQFIINPPPEKTEDEVSMDVLFVGAGPAGLAGAIELAQHIQKDDDLKQKNIEIGVLEKSSDLGGHSLSGAILNPAPLYSLFGKEADFPFYEPVKKDQFYFLTQNRAFRLPTPPTMNNSHNYCVSLCELVRWMGKKAQDLGIHILTSFPAQSLIMQKDKVVGVMTTPSGLNRKGEKGASYTPPAILKAPLTVLTEGTRGPLTQSYLEKSKISSSKPQIFALGVKELWKVNKNIDFVAHTIGWPLNSAHFGGSFMYPMGPGLVSLGLVVGLDYPSSQFDTHKKLQEMKNHPFFKRVLEGGQIEEWGAKTIPEGGYHALPQKLSGAGLLMAGDCVGMVNVPSLKGIHYALQAGRLAGQTAFEALKTQDFSAQKLELYDKKVKNSFIYQDLKKVRNMRNTFKSGLFWGGFKAILMSLTKGAFPNEDKKKIQEDALEKRTFDFKTQKKPNSSLSSSSALSPSIILDKEEAVYKSGNKTRDDIPSHLNSGNNISKKVGEFYESLCPARVYEWREDPVTNKEKLFINAPNCVDCKATDILGPRWQPREGGSGPNYKKM